MKRERKKYEDDDGRTIAKMNVDGMPWYASGAGKPSPDGQESAGPQEKLKGPELRAFIWGMTKALLIVMSVFIVGYLLFILFCTTIWFA
jgi:hypothetical protein